jgi:hypothetical protein
MKIALYNKKNSDYLKIVVDAMYTGMKKHGLDVHVINSGGSNDCDIAVCWGWRKGVVQRNLNKEVLVMEHGYFINRKKWTSLGWNGLNNDADFLNDDVPNDRWNKIFKKHMKPWKEDGKYILLCGQVPKDMSLRGKDLKDWYAEAAKTASEKYDLPVIWRPHPLDKGAPAIKIPKAKLDIKTPLIESLQNAAGIMAFNSNSLIDGVMQGVPAIAFDKGTMTWDICAKDYGPLIRPDRSDWGRKMGYTQWSDEEIANGTAIKHIFKKYLK